MNQNCLENYVCLVNYIFHTIVYVKSYSFSNKDALGILDFFAADVKIVGLLSSSLAFCKFWIGLRIMVNMENFI